MDRDPDVAQPQHTRKHAALGQDKPLRGSRKVGQADAPGIAADKHVIAQKCDRRDPPQKAKVCDS